MLHFKRLKGQLCASVNMKRQTFILTKIYIFNNTQRDSLTNGL